MQYKKLWLYFQLFTLTAFLVFLGYGINTFMVFNQDDVVFATTSTKIYDRNGTKLHELSQDNAVRNTPVQYSQVPQFCIDAIVATEDKTFFTNPGLDRNGVLRFGLTIMSAGQYRAGGSSISQQVVKNINQSIFGRNPLTKYTEASQALKLNDMYSKEEIIMLYLNNVYFGNLNYGIEAASQDFFDKTASELSDAECAYLMGLPQSPSVYHPFANVEAGLERQGAVLDSMIRDEYIDEFMRDEIKNTELAFSSNQTEIRAPHFVQFLQDNAGIKINEFNPIYKLFIGEFNEDFQESYEIYTTYDYELHTTILENLQNTVQQYSDQGINNSASVAINAQGELVTLIGSVDFFNDDIGGKFNSALGHRQPSRTLAPFLYDEFVTNETLQNEQYQLLVLTGPQQEPQVFELYNSVENYSSPITRAEALSSVLEIPVTNELRNYERSEVQQFANSLGDWFRVSQRESYCNYAALYEGCEVPLYVMTLLYHDYLIGNTELTIVNEIRDMNDSTVYQDASLTNNANYMQEQFADTLTLDDWTYVYGYDRFQKDIYVIAWREDLLLGVWFGNTQGDELGIERSQVGMLIEEVIGEL